MDTKPHTPEPPEELEVDTGYTPHKLQQISGVLMVMLVLLSFSLVNIQSFLWTSSDWLVSAVLPSVIVDLTNVERTEGAQTTLMRNSVLDRAATLKAEHMAEEGYFAHYSPDGVSPWHWFEEAGYTFLRAGENLAVHFVDSDAVVDAWMDSPGHRENILNGEYTEIGVGTARGQYQGYDTVFVVQLFGTPGASVQDPNPTTPIVDTAPVIPASSEAEVLSQAETREIPTPDPQEDSEEVLYSNLATTSNPEAIPVVGTLGENTPPPNQQSVSSFFGRAATQPHMWLQIIYSVLAVVIISSLVASIIIEWRRHHPVQIAYGGGLLAGMALLFYVHTIVTAGVLIA